MINRMSSDENKKPGQGIPSYEASPDEYKVICENMTGKLVHMRLKAGESDKPHDHATHYMYVLKGGTVDIDSETEPKGVKTLPSGAAVKMPPGPHQVTNVGKEDIEMLMVEVTGELGPSPEGHVSPLSTDPKCYEVMFEDEDWFVGKMTMKAGTQDHAHSHRHHLIYAAAGDQLTIYPGEDANMQADSDKKLVVDIKPGMAFSAPDGFHIVANSGKQDCELIFWEPKVKHKTGLAIDMARKWARNDRLVDLTIGFMTGNKSSLTKLEAGDWVKKLYSNSGLESPSDEAVQAALGNHTVLNQQQLKEFLLLLVNQII